MLGVITWTVAITAISTAVWVIALKHEFSPVNVAMFALVSFIFAVIRKVEHA